MVWKKWFDNSLWLIALKCSPRIECSAPNSISYLALRPLRGEFPLWALHLGQKLNPEEFYSVAVDQISQAGLKTWFTTNFKAWSELQFESRPLHQVHNSWGESMKICWQGLHWIFEQPIPTAKLLKTFSLYGLSAKRLSSSKIRV